MPDRFYCPDPPRADRFRLGPEESRHLSRVNRLGVGDRVELFDGRGFATLAEVVASSHQLTELIAVGEPIPPPHRSCTLTLATAIPKGDRFDWLVEKATEMGVDRLVPIAAERSVVVPRDSKLDRLRRTVIEACKQCRRATLMELTEPMEWPEVVRGFGEASRFLADPDGRDGREWPEMARGSEVVLAVGPEGGFTPSERSLAIETGWIPIRLGYYILRVETAGLAGCAALQARVAEADE